MEVKNVVLVFCIICLGFLYGCDKPAAPEEIGTAADYMTEYYEDVDAITVEMLDACNTYPSEEAYYNAPLVLLNWYSDDVRLYGIKLEEQAGETVYREKMLLYVQGEKVVIDGQYWNQYMSYPEMNVCDVDSDGIAEVIISTKVIISSSYGCEYLTVCDYEDGWVLYHYDYEDMVKDIEELVDYQYDENADTVTFLDKEEETILAEVPVPDAYDYVILGDSVNFDVEAMKMEMTPGIIMDNNSTVNPYTTVQVIFDVWYQNGEFGLKIDSVAMAVE